MAFTQAQLKKLETAYANGVRIVRHGNRLVEYANMKEMAEAIQLMRSELAASKVKRRTRVFRTDVRKGL